MDKRTLNSTAVSSSATSAESRNDAPSTMRAWQYTAHSGGLENIISLKGSLPLPQPKANEHLVKILAVALNPVDYKVPDVSLVNRIAIKKPAIPAHDAVGRIVLPAKGSGLEAGQLVFGILAGPSILNDGALAEYVAAPVKVAAAAPQGLSPENAAAIPIAGATAWQATVPYIKAGSRVFINGGSGGTGMFGIQFAKHVGAHVSTSCSTANVELCRSLGADNVIDYKQGSVLDALKTGTKSDGLYDHVVDFVGSDPSLYWKMHEYTTSSAKFIEVAGAPSMAFARFALAAMCLPGFLGGGKRPFSILAADTTNKDHLQTIAKLIADGKVRVVIDSTFPFEQAPAAYKKLKTHRAKGKIIISVASD